MKRIRRANGTFRQVLGRQQVPWRDGFCRSLRRRRFVSCDTAAWPMEWSLSSVVPFSMDKALNRNGTDPELLCSKGCHCPAGLPRLCAMSRGDLGTLAAAIGRSGFFKGLSPEACADLARCARVRQLAKREILFTEGQTGEGLCLLVSGRIQLHKASADGSETVIRVVRPGEAFAEVVLLERQDYPVTATSLAPSSVVLLPRRDVLRLLEDAKFRNAFIAMMLRRQRYLAERVRYLTACDVQERLLIFLHEQYGPVTRMTLDLSKKDVAAAIGTTPETLSRLIQRLQSEGLLKWRGKTVLLESSVWQGVSAVASEKATEARFVPA